MFDDVMLMLVDWLVLDVDQQGRRRGIPMIYKNFIHSLDPYMHAGKYIP